MHVQCHNRYLYKTRNFYNIYKKKKKKKGLMTNDGYKQNCHDILKRNHYIHTSSTHTHTHTHKYYDCIYKS